jgi:hypothetical protein
MVFETEREAGQGSVELQLWDLRPPLSLPNPSFEDAISTCRVTKTHVMMVKCDGELQEAHLQLLEQLHIVVLQGALVQAPSLLLLLQGQRQSTGASSSICYIPFHH